MAYQAIYRDLSGLVELKILKPQGQGQELGVRHQDYCGCVYSKAERLLRLRQ